MNGEEIVSVVVVLIVLAVGIFAFSIVMSGITTEVENIQEKTGVNTTTNTVQDISSTANSIFNILGVVIVIGVVMAVVGLVFNFSRPDFNTASRRERREQTPPEIDLPSNVQKTVGDFIAVKVSTSPSTIKESYVLRSKGYWTKIYHDTASNKFITYRSTWKQSNHERGIPKWKIRVDT